jgi:hypothetical protein
MKKKLLIVTIGITLAFQSLAQNDVGLRLGANFGDLNFTNALGEKSKTLKGNSGVFATLLFATKLNGQKAGAKGSYKGFSAPQHLLMIGIGFKSTTIEETEIGLPKSWELNYMTSTISYRFIPATNSVLSFFGGVGITNDFLTSGTQLSDNVAYDISNDIKKLNTGIMAESGLVYQVSESAYAALRAAYSLGLSDLEKAADQKATLNHTEISLSLFFKM